MLKQLQFKCISWYYLHSLVRNQKGCNADILTETRSITT